MEVTRSTNTFITFVDAFTDQWQITLENGRLGKIESREGGVKPYITVTPHDLLRLALDEPNTFNELLEVIKNER